jgi:hypothetical protein
MFYRIISLVFLFCNTRDAFENENIAFDLHMRYFPRHDEENALLGELRSGSAGVGSRRAKSNSRWFVSSHATEA